MPSYVDNLAKDVLKKGIVKDKYFRANIIID